MSSDYTPPKWLTQALHTLPQQTHDSVVVSQPALNTAEYAALIQAAAEKFKAYAADMAALPAAISITDAALLTPTRPPRIVVIAGVHTSAPIAGRAFFMLQYPHNQTISGAFTNHVSSLLHSFWSVHPSYASTVSLSTADAIALQLSAQIAQQLMTDFVLGRVAFSTADAKWLFLESIPQYQVPHITELHDKAYKPKELPQSDLIIEDPSFTFYEKGVSDVKASLHFIDPVPSEFIVLMRDRVVEIQKVTPLTASSLNTFVTTVKSHMKSLVTANILVQKSCGCGWDFRGIGA